MCAGSSYVALTRIRGGENVYLKSFDKYYIKVNTKIEEIINAMIKYRHYEFKKIYLDQKLFGVDESGFKVGYFNINGLKEGNHAHYFNADKNLSHLDFIVLAETKLGKDFGDVEVENSLNYWKILGRYDSQDGRKHMGEH